MHNAYILTNKTLTVVYNGQPKSVDVNHPSLDKVLNLLMDNNYHDAYNELCLVNVVGNFITDDINGHIRFNKDTFELMYKNIKLTGIIADKVINFAIKKLPILPLLNFLSNLYDNPEFTKHDELYLFLEQGNLPITEDGCFVAYKRVNSDYTSIHDGVTLNAIGTVVEMPRESVNNNRDELCSTGLHFCSYEYLQYFNGDKIVLVKVNPKDVVSIPMDYNNTKGRACRYEVISELILDVPIAETLFYNQDTPDVTPEHDVEEILESFREKFYKVGYSDGRKKLPLNTQHSEINEYVDGYKDGKLHRKKRYL